MKDENKNKKELIKEIKNLRKKNKKLNKMQKSSFFNRKINTPNYFLEIAKNNQEISFLLEKFVVEIKKLTNCEAVGIRLLDKDSNIPYQAYEGFSKEFYESESPLSLKTNQCMCINVIKGETNPELPFYTEKGSFYLNRSSHFLKNITEKEKGKTRNVCNEYGYESIGLVPIYLDNKILGLIHIADSKENMIPLPMIQLLETLTLQLGSAVKWIWAEQQLQKNNISKNKYYNSGRNILFALNAEGQINYINQINKFKLNYSPKKNSDNFFLTEPFIPLDIKDQFNHILEGIFKNLTFISINSLTIQIAVLDKNGIIKYTNQSWKSFIKNSCFLSNNLKEGDNYFEFCKKIKNKIPVKASQAIKGIKSILHQNSDIFTLEYPCILEKNIKWLEIKVTPFFKKGPYAAVIAQEDITQRKSREQKLKQEKEKNQYLSFHDKMTGLYNRRYFINEMKRLNYSRETPISIIMIDMDGLKFINDKYGHQMGDIYIKYTGVLLNNIVRKSDILARTGGDEFAIILPATNEKTVKKISRRILQKCKDFNQKKELPAPFQLSLGWAVAKSENENLYDTFNQADQNMYKNKGRRRKKLCQKEP